MSFTRNDYRRILVSRSERQLNVTQRVTAGHGTGMCDMWRSSLVDRKVKGVKGKCSPTAAALESGGKRRAFNVDRRSGGSGPWRHLML